jgi:dTDP-4-amino-4,6-dideoxygalactose transaminase
LEEIYEVARSHGLPVVEDASEALGAEYGGKLVGNTGADFTVFSFYPNRHLSTIEGAAIAFKDPDVFERCRWLRRYGINTATFRLPNGEINPDSDIAEAGWNSCMNQVTSLIGLSQIKTVATRLDAHRVNGTFFDEALKENRKIDLLRRPADSRSAFWVYTLLAKNRQQLFDYLREKGVQSSAVHLRNDLYSCFQSSIISLPGVTHFSKHALSIPCGWWVSKQTRERIVALLTEFDKSHG